MRVMKCPIKTIFFFHASWGLAAPCPGVIQRKNKSARENRQTPKIVKYQSFAMLYFLFPCKLFLCFLHKSLTLFVNKENPIILEVQIFSNKAFRSVHNR